MFDQEFNFIKISDEILLSERLRDIIYDDEKIVIIYTRRLHQN